MTIGFRLMTWLVAAALMASSSVHAQTSPDLWRGVAEKTDPGTELQVRLDNGQRFRATLVGVDDDGLLLQPRTRSAVPVQHVRFDAIVSLERAQGGIGAGKAAAIGIGTGAGAFLGLLLLLFAIVGD